MKIICKWMFMPLKQCLNVFSDPAPYTIMRNTSRNTLKNSSNSSSKATFPRFFCFKPHLRVIHGLPQGPPCGALFKAVGQQAGQRQWIHLASKMWGWDAPKINDTLGFMSGMRDNRVGLVASAKSIQNFQVHRLLLSI